MERHGLTIDMQAVAEFCRRHRIHRLALFGSYLTDAFAPGSDIDVLVEFEPGAVVGLITFAGLEIELSELIGWKIDLRTPEDLSRYFRDKVVSSAKVLYAA